MEDLGFILRLCLHVRVSIEGGEALRISLARFAEKKSSLHHFKLKRWLEYFDRTDGQSCAPALFGNQHAVIFFQLLGEGLDGHSIYDRLVSHEEDLLDLCNEELQKDLDRLPYILMVPLLLLLFPAYMLLLLGPILNMFINELR